MINQDEVLMNQDEVLMNQRVVLTNQGVDAAIPVYVINLCGYQASLIVSLHWDGVRLVSLTTAAVNVV